MDELIGLRVQSEGQSWRGSGIGEGMADLSLVLMSVHGAIRSSELMISLVTSDRVR